MKKGKRGVHSSKKRGAQATPSLPHKYSTKAVLQGVKIAGKEDSFLNGSFFRNPWFNYWRFILRYFSTEEKKEIGFVIYFESQGGFQDRYRVHSVVGISFKLHIYLVRVPLEIIRGEISDLEGYETCSVIKHNIHERKVAPWAVYQKHWAIFL